MEIFHALGRIRREQQQISAFALIDHAEIVPAKGEKPAEVEIDPELRDIVIATLQSHTRDQLTSPAGRDSPVEITQAGSSGQSLTLDALEQQHILSVLEQTNWNKSQAALILGIERSTLDRKLKRYQVARPDR